jgi:hypothetical protein
VDTAVDTAVDTTVDTAVDATETRPIAMELTVAAPFSTLSFEKCLVSGGRETDCVSLRLRIAEVRSFRLRVEELHTTNSFSSVRKRKHVGAASWQSEVEMYYIVVGGRYRSAGGFSLTIEYWLWTTTRVVLTLVSDCLFEL